MMIIEGIFQKKAVWNTNSFVLISVKKKNDRAENKMTVLSKKHAQSEITQTTSERISEITEWEIYKMSQVMQ